MLECIRPADAGWSIQHKSDDPYRWFFTLAMLVHRSPACEG